VAVHPLPEAAMLRQLFEYEPKTGTLVWRPRHQGMAKPDGSLITHREAGIFNTRFAGTPALAVVQPNGMMTGSLFSRKIFAHVVIWALHNKCWPEHEVDHIDGDCQNNRIENLRAVTPSENQRNRSRPKNNTSGCVGVSWHTRDKVWRAYIGSEKGNTISLGSFGSKFEAITARKKAEAQYGYHPNHGRAANG